MISFSLVANASMFYILFNDRFQTFFFYVFLRKKPLKNRNNRYIRVSSYICTYYQIIFPKHTFTLVFLTQLERNMKTMSDQQRQILY
jgi:hypothetical protein